MTGQSSTLVFAAASAAAAVTAGPLAQVVNELSLMMALMGVAGGATWTLANRMGARDFLRSACLGGLLAFGLGRTSPDLVGYLFGDQIGAAFDAGGLGAVAFFIGLMQEPIVVGLKRAARRGGAK